MILVSHFMIVLRHLRRDHQPADIQYELSFSATERSWVQNAHTLAFGGLLLLGVRPGDLLGRCRMFIKGIARLTANSQSVVGCWVRTPARSTVGGCARQTLQSWRST